MEYSRRWGKVDREYYQITKGEIPLHPRHIVQMLNGRDGDWTYILDADGREIEGAMPFNDPPDKKYMVTWEGDDGDCNAYYYADAGWFDKLGNYFTDEWGNDGVAIAYKPWPDPAPWPGEKS